MRYLIKFSYDGTNFYGYQKQPGLRTVENELENALYNINNHNITRIYSSGRTDKGVHALCQVGHFDLEVNISLYKLKCALNSLLPDDIHVFSAKIVDENFHSRFNKLKKTYIYKINVGEYSPIDRNYIYQYNNELNVELMKESIKCFLGYHDFKNFVSNEAVKNDYHRYIYDAFIEQNDDIITFSFTSDGFMKYQVRNMVGTLLKIGSGKLQPDIVYKILEDESFSKFVYTIRPEGLYLKEVVYEMYNCK